MKKLLFTLIVSGVMVFSGSVQSMKRSMDEDFKNLPPRKRFKSAREGLNFTAGSTSDSDLHRLRQGRQQRAQLLQRKEELLQRRSQLLQQLQRQQERQEVSQDRPSLGLPEHLPSLMTSLTGSLEPVQSLPLQATDSISPDEPSVFPGPQDEVEFDDLANKSTLRTSSGKGTASNKLCCACRKRLGNHLDFNCTSPDGVTPLFAAAQRGNKEVFDYLLEQGVDIDFIDNQGNTLLHRAAEGGNREIVKYLVESRDFEQCFDYKRADGITPLHVAALFGKKEVYAYLCELGADLCAIDDRGTTLLHYAVAGANFGIISDLIKHKNFQQFISCERSDGVTPLHIAVETKKKRIIRYLNEKNELFLRQHQEEIQPQAQAPVQRRAVRMRKQGESSIRELMEQQKMEQGSQADSSASDRVNEQGPSVLSAPKPKRKKFDPFACIEESAENRAMPKQSPVIPVVPVSSSSSILVEWQQELQLRLEWLQLTRHLSQEDFDRLKQSVLQELNKQGQSS